MTKNIIKRVVGEEEEPEQDAEAPEGKITFGAPIEPLTEEEIVSLARDVVTNRVFLTTDAHTLGMSFMPIMFLTPDQIPENLGAVYEEYTKAGPRSVDGLPIFYSCKFVAFESLAALSEKIDQMSEALGIPR